MRYTSLLLLVASIPACLSAAEPNYTRYFDPPDRPKDVRLGKPVDLDHPAAFQPAYQDKAAWERRAQRVREQILVANGLWPMPPRPKIEPVSHGKIDRDEYTVEKVYFASLPGHYVTGNLYRPKGRTGKMPGVLCPHGHWSNGRFHDAGDTAADKELALKAEKTKEAAKYPPQAKCAMLARMGCVVFFYDMVGYADSKAIKHREGFSDVECELRLQNAMALQTWNSVRALDFLTSLPDVAASRIGVTGHSGGGTQTFILGAVDDRPTVAFPGVMVSMNMQGGCICENCSLLRIGTNNVEMTALFAPKPLAMTGANDWTRDIETRGLPELRSIYKLYGAEDRVSARYFNFDHNYNQVSREMMYGWFNKHLKLGLQEPIEEKPFVPVPPKELSVFDNEHPRPSDATDAKGVSRYWTETSARQLAELAKKPDDYRRVLKSALRAMVSDDLADVGEVVPNGFKSLKADGFEVHQTLLGRKGSGELIPAIGVVPKGYAGNVVVWVHPEGKASVFDKDNRPVPAVRQLLDANVAVFAPDLFLTGEFHLPGERTLPPSMPQPHHKDVPFMGYLHGYNRSVLANRVHDLLTVIGFMPTIKAKRVYLVALDRAGTWGLLAQALAGDRITSSALDLAGFDFDQVKDADDENFLPGGLKYGGVTGFLPLCASGSTHVFNAPRRQFADLAQGVLWHDGKADTNQVLETFVREVMAGIK